MATAQEYADWLRTNQDKRDTADYKTVLRAFQEARMEELRATREPAAPEAAPETGFVPAARAGFERLKGEAALTAGKLGLMGLKEAEEYRAAREEAAGKIFKPTEEGWTEAPLTKLKELLGQSAPYMVAPIAAAGAAAALPLTGTAAAVATGLAAGATSAAQFTGSNLARQIEEAEKKGEDASLARAKFGNAVAAAIPQAALDVVSLRGLPLIRNLFKSVGKDLTEAEAKAIAEQTFRKTLADYGRSTLMTAGREGFTEAGQQYLERLQAGLKIADEDARKEYIDSFVGGAVLGGTLAPAGRYFERGGEQTRARAKLKDIQDTQRRAEAEEAERKEAEQAELRKQPEYLRDLQARYTGVRDEEQALKDEIAALKKSGDPADAALAKEKQEGLRDFYKDKFNPVRDEYNKAGGTAFFKKFAEQERVAGMTPEDYMFEQMSKEEAAATTKEVARLKARLKQVGKDSNEAKFLKARIAQLQPKAAREVTEEDIIGLPPQAAPSPAEQYAAQRLKLAEEQMSGMADESDLAEYLLQDRGMAQQLVEQGAQLPGLTKQKSKAVLGLVDAQFKADEKARVEADKARLEREAEDLARAQARPEGMTLDEYQAQLREMGYMEPRQEEVQYEARREQRERLTAPEQQQLTLGIEPPPSRGAARAERTITPDGGQRSVVMRDGEVGQDTTSYRYSAEMDGEPVTVRVEKNNLTGAVEAFTEAANRPVGYGMGISKLVKSGMPVEDALKRVAPLDKISLIPYKEAAEAPPVERRMARERELTAPVLIDLLRRGQQAAPTERIRNVLAGLEDNAESLARNKDDAAEVADYVRRMAIAPSQTGVSLQPLQDILTKQEQAKRSETEQLTQYGRRALTEGEKETLVGTTLGPRREIGIVEGDLPKQIANIAQNAKQGTAVREATEEVVRASQAELPFTDRRGEAAQRTATAFGDWAEFQRYLGSEGLQMLRAASEDVTNKGIPNAHRANVLIQNLLQKVNGVTGLRARIDDIVQKRNAIMGKSAEDAAQAKELLLRAVAELERNLRLYAPASVPEMIKSIRTAREKLESAQKVRDELLRQMQDNTTSMEALIQAYERGMAFTVVPGQGRVGEQLPVGEAPSLMLGYEAAGQAARARAMEQARKARDALKAAIDNLVAHQRWIDGAQKDVNFIGPDTPAAEKNFRLKKLNDLLAEEKKLRNAVANANNRFMGLVRRSFAGAEKAPTLPDKAFKDFLVQEAKLTDLLNEQRRRVNGLRLGLNNARMRLNNAYVAMENVPETSTLRQNLRQQLVDAEALEQETRIDLTRRREEVEKLGLTPSQAALEKDAREIERKADAAKRAAQQLAEKRRGAKPEETKADRERRDAEKRREQQAELERREEPVAGKAEEPRGVYAEKPLEARQEEGAPIPRTQVLMEVRRKIRQQVQDKVDQLEALREIAESADSTVDERVEAANEFAKLYKDTLGKLEKRDKKLSNALKVHETAVGKAIEIRERLAQESTLTEGQKKRYKNNPEKAAEVEANQRAALNRQLNSLMLGLDKAAAFLSKNRGIERVQMPTKAEKAAQAEGRVYGEDSEVMAPGAERIARTQTTQRQMGPVVRKGTVAPSQLLTGTEESRKGTTTTGTRNKPVESRGRVERDVAISKQEQQEANLTAEEIQKRHQEQRAKEAAAIAQSLPKTEAELEAQEEEEAIETATPSQLKKRKEKEGRKSTIAAIEEMYGVDIDGDEVRFSKSKGTPNKPHTTATLTEELENALGIKGLRPDTVKVYNTLAELVAAHPEFKGKIPADAVGFVHGGKRKQPTAYLIASNINKGDGLAILLHEVGAHIGFRNLFSESQYRGLANAVKSWATRLPFTVEGRIGRAAVARAKAAKTSAAQMDDEIIAYAVEEAVKAGIRPDAVTKEGGVVRAWLKVIVDKMMQALQKFGVNPKDLKVGDLVNMAYGAAHVELRGTWHGTGKLFKEFDHSFMGTGEGAQMFGWGTYRAQRYGTADWYRQQEAEKQLSDWQQEPKIVRWRESQRHKYNGLNAPELFRIQDYADWISHGVTELDAQDAAGYILPFGHDKAGFDKAKQFFAKYGLDKLTPKELGELAASMDTADGDVFAGHAYDLGMGPRARVEGHITDKALLKKIKGGQIDGVSSALTYNGESMHSLLSAKDPFRKAVRDVMLGLDTLKPGTNLRAEFIKRLEEKKAKVKEEIAEDRKLASPGYGLDAKERAFWQAALEEDTALLEAFEQIDVSKLGGDNAVEPPIPKPKGVMKRVLSVRPESEYYMLDLPLKDQNQYVQDAVENALDDLPLPEGATGRAALTKSAAAELELRDLFAGKKREKEFIKELQRIFRQQLNRTPKDASMWLFEHGIAGYKYLDAAARSGALTDADARFNYVDFGDKAEGPAIIAANIERIGVADDILFSRQPKYSPALANAGRIADQTISERPGFFAKLKENMLGMGFRTQFIDALAPLEAVAGRMGDAVKSMQMMYYLRMYGYRMHLTSEAIDSGVPQLVKKMRRDGTPEWVIEAVEGANIKDIVKTLSAKDVIKAAGSADAANRLFTLYLAKLRADNKGYDALNFGRAAAEAELKEIERDLASDKVSSEDKARMRQRQAHLNKVKNTLPTEADIKAAFAEIQANPVLRDAFAVARDQYNAYNQDLLRFMVQAGAMSKAEAERLLKNKDYIPYYRVRDGVAQLMIGGETPVRIGNLKDSPHLQELVGGEEPIFSFLDSSVQNTSMLIDMAMRNIAVKNAMWEMGKMGYAKLKKAGKAGAPKGAVEFKVDGEDWYALVDTEHIGVPSDLLVKGLAGVPTMLPAAVEMMGVPARFLRRAVTASPVYAFRQLMRDSTAAYISSGSNELPMLGALRQIGKASAIQRRGVTGGQVFTGMPEDMSRLLREMQEGRPGWSKAFSKLEALSMEADALTRRSQYESYIKQGLSEMEATMMTIESMNFMRRGLSPSMHMVASLIPFMNAQIQSLDVLYRSFRGQMPFNERLAIREKLIARGMMLAGMSIMYALAMQDDEDYKNAKPDEKYNNWFVKIPGIEEPMRIPIPFELGYIFKALPEAIINTMYAERGADEAKDAALGILRNLIPGGSNYLVPQAVKPLIEVGLGKSFYTGRDIETGSEQQQEPWARYRETTSGAAKFLGELFNVSPVKLESLVSGYTGSMGLALLQATNFIFPTPESAPAEKRLSEMPVIGTLFQPKDATGIINDTFDRLKEATEAKNTYNKLIERGDLKKAEAYLAQNANRIALASLAGDFRQQIGELTTAERQIRGAQISPAEKREVLDALRQSKILVASSVRAALGGTELR